MSFFRDLSLLKKLFLIAFLPSVGLVFMSALYLNFVWLERKETLEGLDQIVAIKALSVAAHELQRERGVSLEFVNASSGGGVTLPSIG